MAGAVLMGLLLCWFSPCSGMDVLTPGELESLSGRHGISLAFGGRFTAMKTTFQSISQGDPDGWGTGISHDDNAGWLVLIGNGSNTGTLSFVVPDGVQMDIDVGMTPASTFCRPAGGAPYGGIVIPKNTPFFTFSMTDALIALYDPLTVNICLTNNARLTVDGDYPEDTVNDMEIVGWMQTEELKIDKAVMRSECYIWALK